MTITDEANSTLDELDQGGLEQVVHVDRTPSLTGIRALAALLVVATHAAYTTGKYTQGYFGLVCSRMEIGVPIFFVLSGFLLFRPWVRALAGQRQRPSVRRYARHRVRRIMPPFIVTVLVAYGVYHFREAGPNNGHTSVGLIRNLTLTQIYTNHYFDFHAGYLHQGLTQMWSLAVEVAFYAALPPLAWGLVTWWCNCRWQPIRLLWGLGVLALISPGWLALVHTTAFLPDGARLWLPGYLAWFLGGMLLAVLQVVGVICYGFVAIPLAVICYLIASTPLAGDPTTAPPVLGDAVLKVVFYGVIATLAVAPLALGNRGWYAALLASRPMVWLGEISYEIFLVHLVLMEIAMVEIVRARVYTGSMTALFAATLALTIPAAWLLHRLTRVHLCSTSSGDLAAQKGGST